jgi:hypothetical protein
MTPLPPFVPAAELQAELRAQGYAVLDAAGTGALLRLPLAALDALPAFWNDLPPDAYLRDGGRYRKRRHASFTVEGEQVRSVPHRAHWQPRDYNALHGGFERWFEPIAAEAVALAGWQQLLRSLAGLCSELKGAQRWYVEAHQFRIDTADGIGRPTPEGAHRDGVDFVAVMMVARYRIKGGETRVFEANGPRGIRFTLTEPWSALLLDDERVIHETTPIQPADPAAGPAGYRDTLVITLRSRGFLDPA